jgi:hypothetical protein
MLLEKRKVTEDRLNSHLATNPASIKKLPQVKTQFRIASRKLGASYQVKYQTLTDCLG